MAKRVTPDSDYQRLAENIYLNKGRFIETKEDFQTHFRDYLKDTSVKNNDKLMEKTAKFYQAKRGHFKEPSPRQKTKLKEQRARHFPKAASQVRQKPDNKEFKFLRQEKGRTVYAREIVTKAGVRFIDRKGRYTGLRK